MGGGLMQLVAYGAQDIYLTGNPQITFFKVVYRRHTNFSMEAIQQTFEGEADFGKSVTATISRNGDLIHRMYLEHEAKLKAVNTGTNDEIGVVSNYGSLLMKEMEIEIGGQTIDKHYGHWHATWSQLTEFNPTGSPYTLFNRMSGNGTGKISGQPSPDEHANTTGGGWESDHTASPDILGGRFFIPLYFWFCRNPGLALPLIALQYHEVKVKFAFEDLIGLMAEDTGGVWYSGTTTIDAAPANNDGSTFTLWCDYIYLDTDERRRFAQVSHEYLIEQVQHSTIDESGNFTSQLYFNHPVKELIWSNVIQNIFAADSAVDLHGGVSQDNMRYVRAPFSIDGKFQLKLNGHDRFSARDSKYFTRTQVWEHHTGYGGFIGQTNDAGDARGIQAPDTIAVYSFALKPEEHQPSGTCNFSRIDTAQLVRSSSSTILTGGLNIYAVNYNVLRIMSGMGGLAYSN